MDGIFPGRAMSKFSASGGTYNHSPSTENSVEGVLNREWAANQGKLLY